MKQVAHHEYGQHQTGNEQWDPENKTDRRALTKG